MSAVNKATKKDYPVIWEDMWEFKKDETYHEHRRNSNYYTAWLLELTPDNLPDHPELHGLWETDTFIADHEYGVDKSDIPDEIWRVEKKTRTIEEAYYERVVDAK